jgi:hypothetical protein
MASAGLHIRCHLGSNHCTKQRSTAAAYPPATACSSRFLNWDSKALKASALAVQEYPSSRMTPASLYLVDKG